MILLSFGTRFISSTQVTKQVQVPITPDQVQLEQGQRVVTTGTLISRFNEFYSTEIANVLKR